MKDSQRARDLAMVLIANGKIPFDPANPSGSVKILSRHLDALETALHEEAILADTPLSRPVEKRTFEHDRWSQTCVGEFFHASQRVSPAD